MRRGVVLLGLCITGSAVAQTPSPPRQTDATMHIQQQTIDMQRQPRIAQQPRQADIDVAQARERQAERDRDRAESASDNKCRNAETKNLILENLNQSLKEKNSALKVVGLEHVTTKKFQASDFEIICHVTADLTNGDKISGTYMRRTVTTGQAIYGFELD